MITNKDTDTISVSELNNKAKRLLESQIEQVSVEGEVSNFTRAASGHFYFTLKDDRAQISCAMFATANRYLKVIPEQGDKIIVKGKVSLYAPRGSFQLIISSIQSVGIGQWQIAFAELQRKLASEGLFDQQNKRDLPILPKMLGIVSSLKGAVVHDIIRTVRRRYDLLPIRIYPSSVQGEQANSELIEAIELAQKDSSCDVLIIARGGGSIEDLWSFNSESVARAIAQCSIVTVSAVGHENDYTIADYVADVRASTPSVAAELVTPEKIELISGISKIAGTITERINAYIDNAQMGLDHLSARLVHPGMALELRQQQLDKLATRLGTTISNILDKKIHELKLLGSSLKQLDHHKQLQRGYIMARTLEGQVVTNTRSARLAQKMNLTFVDGDVEVTTSVD